MQRSESMAMCTCRVLHLVFAFVSSIGCVGLSAITRRILGGRSPEAGASFHPRHGFDIVPSVCVRATASVNLRAARLLPHSSLKFIIFQHRPLLRGDASINLGFATSYRSRVRKLIHCRARRLTADRASLSRVLVLLCLHVAKSW